MVKRLILLTASLLAISCTKNKNQESVDVKYRVVGEPGVLYNLEAGLGNNFNSLSGEFIYETSSPRSHVFMEALALDSCGYGFEMEIILDGTDEYVTYGLGCHSYIDLNTAD